MSGQKRRNIGGDVVYICAAIGHCECYSRLDCSGHACCVSCHSLAFVTEAETVAGIREMSEIDANGSIELDCPTSSLQETCLNLSTHRRWHIRSWYIAQ